MNGSAVSGPEPLGILPPGVHRLRALPDIAAADADRLGRLGIHTTADLRGADLPALARASGLGLGLLQQWRDTADLLALEGVGPAFAAALLQAGLSNVRILARLTPGDVERFLRRAMHHSGADDDGFGQPRGLDEQCRRLVEQAKLAELAGPLHGPAHHR